MDLGSGCGLTSITLHQIGFKVIATDNARVLPLLQQNINQYLSSLLDDEINPNSMIIKELDWTQANFSEELFPDFIVCSDCIYDSLSVDPLINILLKV